MAVNPLDMQGRTVLVTGASSGIGRETAILLSELDARVVLVARNRERLEETLGRMSGEGHRIEPFDLNETDGIPDWIKRIATETGPLGGLVHSAGIFRVLPLQSESASRIESLMRINLTSAIMIVKGFRRSGCALRGSGIVLLSSAAGIVGAQGISTYSASKAALIGFTRSAALELVASGLRINCVAPGMVETEMVDRSPQTPEQVEAVKRTHPLGLGAPRDVAHAIVFLLADTGRWITGSTLVVDGGYSAS
jgi:NAD(P)-dependent dehydrogenase (short-subunit alcohol dehydrogenase family)